MCLNEKTVFEWVGLIEIVQKEFYVRSIGCCYKYFTL